MTEGGPSVISIFVVIWTQVTIAVLGLLLYFGRRPQHKLGRIGVQVHILCVLALSWIPLIVGLLATNSRVCWWGGATCGPLHLRARLCVVPRYRLIRRSVRDLPPRRQDARRRPRAAPQPAHGAGVAHRDSGWGGG
ncbi:hypothetical protein B0H14DRAFT_2858444, partial [Mycena olivaceomarginata]